MTGKAVVFAPLRTLFVYGTLRTDIGTPLPADIQPYMELGTLVEVVQLQGYQLRDCGPYPGIHINEDETVIGQLFSFDGAMPDVQWYEFMRKLDEYEGAPELYSRRVLHTMTHSGKLMEAWGYTSNNPTVVKNKPAIPSGDWAVHRANKSSCC